MLPPAPCCFNAAQDRNTNEKVGPAEFAENDLRIMPFLVNIAQKNYNGFKISELPAC